MAHKTPLDLAPAYISSYSSSYFPARQAPFKLPLFPVIMKRQALPFHTINACGQLDLKYFSQLCIPFTFGFHGDIVLDYSTK